MFITFEGLDFCGKSTQVKLLEQYFLNQNKNIEIIREPGGTQISEKIRRILLDKKNIEMCSETELLLFSSSRVQLIKEVILPKLEKGTYVISDRFHDSLTAYQGYGRKMDLDFIAKLNSFVLGNAIPDVTFFIDIPIEEVSKRKNKNNNIELDRIENSDTDFYERVREGYLEISKSEKRFVKIDGTQTEEQIHKIIIDEINNRN